jgi:hypothetical protein
MKVRMRPLHETHVREIMLLTSYQRSDLVR